ncbi:MAG: AmmeMemoRadiSam system radical SAM enzyme [Pirellulales bacterium]|nr:AmmeMemoRadiSam system radical SAM enzyme [Pirellulales bacterium]
MTRQVESPPPGVVAPGEPKPAGWWHEVDAGRLMCDVCPRGCVLGPDDRGFCFVRQNREGRMVSTTYGRSTGFCIDPIEKKPLAQFYPGTPVLSFGTAGCNLGCRFCQNWTSTKSREVERFSEEAAPETIAAAARELGCRSVAYTYNDPIVWVEYAIDTARAVRAAGLKNVAVTSGYMLPKPRAAFYEWIDAANVDLKAFDESFYRRLCAGRLEPVLDTLRWLARETDVWLEITNLVIPRENDVPDDMARMCQWLVETLGPDVPVHFSAFHPDFHLTDRGPTPPETLLRAYDIAQGAGLKYVYTGNVVDVEHQTTYCPGCGGVVIERTGYELSRYALRGDCCAHCGAAVAGRYDQRPGDWGSRRQPVRIGQYAGRRTADDPGAERASLTTNQGEQSVVHKTTHGAASPAVAAERPILDKRQEAEVFQAAGATVAAAVAGGPVDRPAALNALVAAKPLLGAFVSLKRAGQLRSCCGFLGPEVALGEAIHHAAVRAARDDPRFPPISPTELTHLDMEVWLLWGMRPVEAKGEDRVAAVEIGRHGLQIQRGAARGLLLPAVAVEHGLDAAGFLRQVCLKAQLPSDAWKDDSTQLMTFEGYAIRGPLKAVVESPTSVVSSGGPTAEQLGALADFCRRNLAAMVEGATPSYYLADGFDGSVHGVILGVELSGVEGSVSVSRLSVKPTMPLQSTLFSVLQALAGGLSARGIRSADLEAAKINLSVLWDPALHGTTDAPDLAGLDPSHRIIIVLGRSGWACVYDASQSAEAVLAEAVPLAQLGKSSGGVMSMAIASSAQRRVVATNVLSPEAPRPAAVAGMFYPGNVREMNSMLDSILPADRKHERWAGAMVPHAGWIYSGRLAADVLSRIEFPSRAIVFAPKHNAVGADWAVAPHRRWVLPGGHIESDPELAEQLAGAIDGLELDGAAHRPEHAIEVELPLVARLAPQTRVVGVAMYGGDWPRLERFAEQLAGLIQTMDERPLLIVSSDMNHRASDADTRRLDRMALDAIEARDPKRLLDVVRQHRITMCGVVPAVVVMETLRRLGSLETCELVGYTTSAERTGDTSQVVGYAGVLFR